MPSVDHHQQELVNIIKAAHQNLSIARKTAAKELTRRRDAEALRVKNEAALALEAGMLRVKMELDAEVETHASALDEALIAAYNAGVPIRRIALDGFGNRYDGGVHQMLRAVRVDGRLGNREGYQRNTGDGEDTAVTFPKPIDVNQILADATNVAKPKFTLLPEPLVLLEAGTNGEDEVSVMAIQLEMDSRDPYFAQIAKNARKNTPFRHATTCTIYMHPATGELMTHESRETGESTWDHPVARWVKDNPDDAMLGVLSAIKVPTE